MDAAEKQLRASKYRIEIEEYFPSGYESYSWTRWRVYRPRKWFRGFFYISSGTVCEFSRDSAYSTAESRAKDAIKADIENRYNKKNKVEGTRSKTIYVEAE